MTYSDPSQYPGQPGGSSSWGPPPASPPPSGHDTPGYTPGYGVPSSGSGASSGGYGAPAGGYSTPYGPTTPSYGTPPPANSGEGTNGFAIASLICGILAPCAGLLSVIFGIVALVQLRRRPQKGKGMAIAGLVLTALWTVATAVFVFVAVDRNTADRDPDTGTITSGGEVSVLSLEPGDCVNGLEDGSLSLTLPAVPCDEPHEAEVYSVFDVTLDGEWPGEDPILDEAESRCLEYMERDFPETYADDQVDIFYLYPSEDTWRTGDREVVCFAYYLDGRRTGSIVN